MSGTPRLFPSETMSQLAIMIMWATEGPLMLPAALFVFGTKYSKRRVNSAACLHTEQIGLKAMFQTVILVSGRCVNRMSAVLITELFVPFLSPSRQIPRPL
jgi:hypothetical protein